MAELTRVKPICCVSLRFYAVFLGWEWSIDPAISDHADRPFRLCHAGSNACELTSDFNTDAQNALGNTPFVLPIAIVEFMRQRRI